MQGARLAPIPRWCSEDTQHPRSGSCRAPGGLGGLHPPADPPPKGLGTSLPPQLLCFAPPAWAAPLAQGPQIPAGCTQGSPAHPAAGCLPCQVPPKGCAELPPDPTNCPFTSPPPAQPAFPCPSSPA